MDDIPRYKTCYIAFLDLLGFKKLISLKSCEDIVQIFNEIKKPKIQEIFKKKNEKWETLIDHESILEVELAIISDSMCFYIDSSKQNAFSKLLAVCYAFQLSMATRDDPILMRGGIVQGEIYTNGDITFGPGLTAAYLLEENNAQFPRIIILMNTLEEAKNKAEKDFVDFIDTITTFDKDGYYIIDYFKALPHDVDKPAAAMAFNNHINTVLGYEVNPSIRGKYLYLKDHVAPYLLF